MTENGISYLKNYNFNEVKHIPYLTEELLGVAKFHKSIPIYEETPLYDLKYLADYLGIKKILVKDESKRMRGSSSNILAISYMLGVTSKKYFRQGRSNFSFDRFIWQVRESNLEITVPFDSNEEEVISWAYWANYCNFKINIFISSQPANWVISELNRLKSNIIETNLKGKDLIEESKKYSILKNNLFIPSSSLTTKSGIIGYSTVINEIYSQMGTMENISHIILPVRTGAFAASMISFLRKKNVDYKTKILILDQTKDSSFYKMLNTGSKEVQNIPDYRREIWSIFRSNISGIFKNHPSFGELGTRILYHPLLDDVQIRAIPEKAVPIGLLFQSKNHMKIREILDIDNNSEVLMISEGSWNPNILRDALWGTCL